MTKIADYIKNEPNKLFQVNYLIQNQYFARGPVSYIIENIPVYITMKKELGIDGAIVILLNSFLLSKHYLFELFLNLNSNF